QRALVSPGLKKMCFGYMPIRTARRLIEVIAKPSNFRNRPLNSGPVQICRRVVNRVTTQDKKRFDRMRFGVSGQFAKISRFNPRVTKYLERRSKSVECVVHGENETLYPRRKTVAHQHETPSLSS